MARTAADPALSLVPKSLPAAHESDPVGAGTKGDAAKAKALLAQAGVTTPRAVHRGLPVEPDRRQGDGGPRGRLAPGRVRPARPSPITDDYFTAISDPALADQVDVFWSNWAPAWASASTILPPLFDSSINITKVGPGRDYGYWADKDLDARMAKVNTIADRTAREKAWADIDASLMAKGAYIGLAERRALYIAGSDVRNLSANTVAGGVVEFADIAVVQ